LDKDVYVMEMEMEMVKVFELAWETVPLSCASL